MKHSITVVLILLGNIMLAASYSELKKEADSALKTKDIPAALAKYEEAEKAAETSAERLACILARNSLLRSTKQYTRAVALLKSHLEDEKLADQELRRLVNTYAAQIMWGGKEQGDEALALLNQAQLLKTNLQNDFFATYYLAGHIQTARKQYGAVIELVQNIIKVKDMHPANLYAAYSLCGGAYEKLGNQEKALDAYRKAVDAGKKVKYRFDYSSAEKAVERLSK